jgi:hypothetical protein
MNFKQLLINEGLYTNDQLEDLLEDFPWGKIRLDFTRMEEKLTGYDEGAVTTTTIFQHNDSGKFFEVQFVRDSWSEYNTSPDELEGWLVQPVEVKVIQYQRI